MAKRKKGQTIKWPNEKRQTIEQQNKNDRQ